MNIEALLSGDINDVALFGINAAPTREEIEGAIEEAKTWGEAAEKLVASVGLRPGHHVHDQPVFGPLTRMLSLAGWTYAGSGFFSAVFYRNGLAIKISLRGSSDAAMDYLWWAKDNQGMAGVPVVHAMKQGKYTYTCLMDRLEGVRHLLNRNNDEHDEYLRAEYEDVKAALEQGDKHVYKGFRAAKTAIAIREQFVGKGAFDMHFGNVMMDRDGNLIITDPLGRSDERPRNYGGASLAA